MDVLLVGLGFAVSSLYAALWGQRFINLIGERLVIANSKPESGTYYKVIEPYPEIKVFDIEEDEDDNLDSDSESEDEDVLVVG